MVRVNNPNTIAYDNWVAGYHASTIRNTDGTFSIWGENMDATGTGNLLSPQVINSATYPGLTGTVLKASVGGYNQAIILTTDGLFTVGSGGSRSNGYVLSTSVINNSAFTKLNASITPYVAHITNGVAGTGLPPGVGPTKVKMMFASSNVLAITTCDGEVWVISSTYAQLRGNGNAAPSATSWYKVKKSLGVDLTDIVATRGSGTTLYALNTNGDIWTWGFRTIITTASSQNFATKMPLPPLSSGSRIKMIGATASSAEANVTYYALATDGKLFSLGDNNQRQLGLWNASTTPTLTWLQPTYAAGTLPMDNIKWISPQEHYTSGSLSNGEGSASINVINSNGILYNWGYNRRGMLGRPNKQPSTPNSPDNMYDPAIPENSLTAVANQNDPYQINSSTTWNAVETGGHTTMAVRPCETKLIYAGHQIHGSMGNNDVSDSDYNQYYFTNDNTPELKICGASAVNHQIAGGVTTFCQGSTFTVNSSPAGGTYNVTSGNATGNNPFTVTGPGDIVITYTSSCGSPDTFILYQKDFGNLTFPYPQASATINASNSVWLGPNVTGIPNSDCSIQPTDAADGFSITNAVCGSGTSATPWTVRANQTLTFNVTINGSGAQKPVYWALWYDVNGDGDFTDTDDMFYTGNSTHNGPTPTSFQTIIPTSVTTLPANTIAAIRIVATASLTTFTKQLNGDVQLANGEVEDYFINYNTATVCENCFNLPTGGLPDSYTKTGISSLEGFANGWPNNVPNGFIAIESKNKGFVITRIKNVSLIPTANLVAGMLVYEIDASCVKLFNGTSWKCLEKDCIPIAINP
ncbi:MAG: hypothetical protein EOO87_14780 [Pedobacter sp.]|nr:MAG: hypothetical protein EOO87_14780 [Pedobacter sp.]